MGQRHTSTSASPSYGAIESDDVDRVDEDDRLLYAEPRAEEEVEVEEPLFSGAYSTSSSDTEIQDGVRKIEAISKTWTKKSLIIAYIGFVLSPVVVLSVTISRNRWLMALGSF